MLNLRCFNVYSFNYSTISFQHQLDRGLGFGIRTLFEWKIALIFHGMYIWAWHQGFNFQGLVNRCEMLLLLRDNLYYHYTQSQIQAKVYTKSDSIIYLLKKCFNF